MANNNVFATMLATNESATFKTLADAMCEWWMASDRADAVRQIVAAPGEDLAGIKNSVVSGLTVLADALGVDVEDLLSEEKIQLLREVTATQVVAALNAIHTTWIEDNFSARRWAEKYFNGQLFQYRKTAKLPWKEVKKDLLFIAEYLTEGGNTGSDEEMQVAFAEFAAANSEDDDMDAIAVRAREFAPAIIEQIQVFRGKQDPTKEKGQAMIARIDDFLSQHTDGGEIMEIMIAAVV